MLGEALFFGRDHAISPLSSLPDRLYSTTEEGQTLPVKNGADEITYFFLGIGVLMLLLLAVGVVLIYRLTHKSPLNSFLQQHMRDRASEECSDPDTSEGEEDAEALLYKRLCDLMEKEQVFKNIHLNREVLAERLDTNHVYLAKAVRKYAKGVTVGEFINDARLKYAADLLTHSPDLNIDEIKQMSGFNSRTTFGRLFREKYGMSPTKFRTRGKEKRG